MVATVTDSVGGFSSMITRQEVWMEMAGADQCHFPMAWEATPSWAPCSLYILGHIKELELELIQTHMAQKPMLRVEGVGR